MLDIGKEKEESKTLAYCGKTFTVFISLDMAKERKKVVLVVAGSNALAYYMDIKNRKEEDRG